MSAIYLSGNEPKAYRVECPAADESVLHQTYLSLLVAPTASLYD